MLSVTFATTHPTKGAMSSSDDCCTKATASPPATLTSSDLLSSITCAFEITASNCDSSDQQETYETLRRHHSSEGNSHGQVYATDADAINSNPVATAIQSQFANVYSVTSHNSNNNNYYDQYEYTNGHGYPGGEATWLPTGRNEDSSLDLSHHHAHVHHAHSSQQMNYSDNVTDISHSHAFPLHAASAATAAYYSENAASFSDGANNLLANYWPVPQLLCEQSQASSVEACSPTSSNFALNGGMCASGSPGGRASRRSSSKRINTDPPPNSPMKLRKSSRSSQSTNSSSGEAAACDIETKFAMTVEFLKSCNLYDITMRTAEINRLNCQLQEQIDSLQDEMTNTARLYSS